MGEDVYFHITFSETENVVQTWELFCLFAYLSEFI